MDTDLLAPTADSTNPGLIVERASLIYYVHKSAGCGLTGKALDFHDAVAVETLDSIGNTVSVYVLDATTWDERVYPHLSGRPNVDFHLLDGRVLF